MKSKTRKISAAGASLVLALAMLVGISQPASAAVTVGGQIQCITGKLVGIWIDAPSGGSGWASWSYGANNTVARYSKSLPNGGNFRVEVGCGGEPGSWGSNIKSGYYSASSNRNFTCYYNVPRTPQWCQLA